MGSSSSSTAAAAAAAAASGGTPNSLVHGNPYHQQQQQYFRSSNEYASNRYEYEYCYGGGGGGGSSQQVIQSGGGGSSRDLFAQSQQNQQVQHHNLAAQSQPSSSSSSNNVKHEKKKKWWKRRSSRSSDPGQPLRELLGNWSLGEVVALVHEYETMTNEKELYIHAESSRPRAPTLRSDLADLLDFKWNSDVNLILPPAIFPAHRAILMQRSKYFRNLLNNSSNVTTNGNIVNVNVEDTSVDIPTFSGLLRYLYTEEVPSNSQHNHHHSEQQSAERSGGQDQHHHHHHHHVVGTIVRPSKPLESDLRDLLQTGKYSDIVLVLGDEQFAVHKAILAARSPFFRSLLQRRSNSKKIVLDDTVIPKRYARVILNCMYTDKVDLTLIEPSRSGLSEVESLTFTGKVNPSGFEEAMELYQIGRFLEFDHLCVCSEDIITEQLTHDSLPQILRWSSQSHGSSWVRRQALMYVQEEYLTLISTPSFLELDKHTIVEVVQSDFLQASEVEVLNSIIKWGEHQLIKRVEDREPNLVSSTRDSVFRNNNSKSKRRNASSNAAASYASDLHLNDSELREIVFELIRCVRTDHIPLSNESLVAAVRRGLVSIPPTHMITEEKVNPWVNNLQCPNYIRPRLYTPYYEEAKSALRQRTGANNSSSTECLGGGSSSSNPVSGLFQSSSSHLAYLNSIGRIKTLRPIIPDTLYMIENDGNYGHHHHHHHHHNGYLEKVGADKCAAEKERKREEDHRVEVEIASRSQAQDGANKVNASSSASGSQGPTLSGVEELVVDQELLNAMLYREKKLRSAHLRNLSNPISRERATRYIRLRVVREFGYPDYVAELLDHHNRASLNQPLSTTTSAPATTTTSSVTTQTTTTTKTCNVTEDYEITAPQPTRSPVHHTTSSSSTTYHPPPPLEFHTNMPDVAMNTNDTTEAVVREITIPSSREDALLIPLLDLDLGDSNLVGGGGSSSSGGGGGGSSIRGRPNRGSFGSLSTRSCGSSSSSIVRLQQQVQQSVQQQIQHHHPINLSSSSSSCFAGTLPHPSQQQPVSSQQHHHHHHHPHNHHSSSLQLHTQQQHGYHRAPIQYTPSQYSVYASRLPYGVCSTTTTNSSTLPPPLSLPPVQQLLHHHPHSSSSSASSSSTLLRHHDRSSSSNLPQSSRTMQIKHTTHHPSHYL